MNLAEMNPVCRGYLPSRMIAILPWPILLLVSAVVAAVVTDLPVWCVVAILASLTACVVWLVWLLRAQAHHRRWVENPDELLITRGCMWRTVTAVPYGRIQFVDVTAGPVERLFGVASVKLHTASATSDSTVVGLTTADASALRDRLAVAARERMSGL